MWENDNFECNVWESPPQRCQFLLYHYLRYLSLNPVLNNHLGTHMYNFEDEEDAQAGIQDNLNKEIATALKDEDIGATGSNCV